MKKSRKYEEGLIVAKSYPKEHDLNNFEFRLPDDNYKSIGLSLSGQMT